MINESELFLIGAIVKAHGLKGELVLNVLDDTFDVVEPECLFLEIDSIFVPFFVSDYRYKSEQSLLVRFEGIDDQDKAKPLIACKAYIERSKLVGEHEQELSLRYLIGFEIVSEQGQPIGKIVDVDDNTDNWLFVLEDDKLVPAADELIVEIDHEKRQLTMNIPEGLLEI